MLLANRINIGPLVPEDFGPLFCWANDVVAARLDFAYRPVDMMTHQQWWNGLGKDPTRVVFATKHVTATSKMTSRPRGVLSVHGSCRLAAR